MIPVVGKGGVGLAEAELRVLLLDLFRSPVVGTDYILGKTI